MSKEVFFKVCENCARRDGCDLALHWWFEGVRLLDRCDFKEVDASKRFEEFPWLDEVMKFWVEVFVSDNTVFIHKPIKDLTVLAHSAIRVTEAEDGFFEIQANLVLRNGAEQAIKSLGVTRVYLYPLDERCNLAQFTMGVSSPEKLVSVLRRLLEISI